MQKSLRAGEAVNARTIFPEIKFLRVNPTWQESSRTSTLSGADSCAGQIFKRYELKLKTSVMMDFWFRGHALSQAATGKLCHLLSTWGCLTGKQLIPHIEILGIAGDSFRRDGEKAFVSQIQSAEVGAVHGKMILALRWHDVRLRRKFLSIYFAESKDSAMVHEIHFSAPQDEFDKYDHVYSDTLRSIQWNAELPPPMFMGIDVTSATPMPSASMPTSTMVTPTPICVAVA